jgi:uncharacterized protein YdhG (YjbR/CyaY superfamily)
MVMDKASSIDEYLQMIPEDQRALLGAVRDQINKQGPEVEETISYNMPTFKLRSKPLIHIAAWKKHCSFYPITDAVVEAYAESLAGFKHTKGSLHFTTKQPIPQDVLEAMIQDRVADHEASGY